MRNIKFRAKDSKTNEWVYGGYYKHLKRTPCPIGDSIKASDYEHLIINSGFSDWNMPKPIDCFSVNEKTIGQYTGIKDKNSKEIYENDILSDGLINYVVAFYAGAWCLKLSIEDSTWYALYPVACQREVVGNIYENPELLSA